MTKYLLTYAPKPTTISAACWEKIGRFVIEAASDVLPKDQIDAQALVVPIAQFVAWQHLSSVPLVREEMFTWEAVDSFIRTEAKPRMTPYGRRLYRTHLRRVVDVVHGPRPVSLNRAELGKLPGVRPYTAQEERAFRIMVSNQRTEHRRLNGEVLLALGFGAGLTTAEICRVHGHDIVQTDEGVEIHLSGESARVVPLFSEWESVLLAAAERVGPRRVFMPNSKTVGRWAAAAFIKLLEGKSTDLQVQRMRATWIIRLLDGGIRANVLLEVAGTIDTCWLIRYVNQMVPVPSAQAHASIRALSRSGAEVPA